MPLKPLQSLVLRHSPSQQTSGFNFASLLMTLLPPPRRLSHLARKEAKAVKVQVAQRTPKSSAGTVANSGSGKGSKRAGKKAGMAEKPH